MSFKISFANDVTNALEEARGSDGRLNVSSRSDSRAYYNSRDEGLTFSAVFDMSAVMTDEFFAYWRNASATLDLVITSISVWGGEAMSFKLHFMDATAATGGCLYWRCSPPLRRQRGCSVGNEAADRGRATMA